jgi:hypothetical protein
MGIVKILINLDVVTFWRNIDYLTSFVMGDGSSKPVAKMDLRMPPLPPEFWFCTSAHQSGAVTKPSQHYDHANLLLGSQWTIGCMSMMWPNNRLAWLQNLRALCENSFAQGIQPRLFRLENGWHHWLHSTQWLHSRHGATITFNNHASTRQSQHFLTFNRLLATSFLPIKNAFPQDFQRLLPSRGIT